MKKLFFSMLAISLLSTSAVMANGGKPSAKKHKATTTCSQTCLKTKDCPKGVPCPSRPGCVCH